MVVVNRTGGPMKKKRHRPGPAPLYGKSDILIWAKIPLPVSTWLDREAKKIKTPLTAMGRTRMRRAQLIRQILIAAMESTKQQKGD
jgi:hypothetical protein